MHFCIHFEFYSNTKTLNTHILCSASTTQLNNFLVTFFAKFPVYSQYVIYFSYLYTKFHKLSDTTYQKRHCRYIQLSFSRNFNNSCDVKIFGYSLWWRRFLSDRSTEDALVSYICHKYVYVPFLLKLWPSK